MPFAYIASPYSSPHNRIMRQRFYAVEQYVHRCLKTQDHVFSPIVHCHAIAHKYGLPTDAAFWWDYNVATLSAASALRILCFEGWEFSTGVRMEHEYALAHHIPVVRVPIKRQNTPDIMVA